MPFTMPNFPILTFEQANPLLAGIKYGAGIGNDLLQAIQRSLENQKMQAELPFAGELAKSTAAYKNAMAKYLESPTQALRNLTPLGKQYLEPNLLPAAARYYGVPGNVAGNDQQISGQYGESQGGQTQYSSEVLPVNEESDIQRTYRRQRELKTTDPVIRRQAEATQELSNLANQIDTSPLEEFAGLGGKLKYGQEASKGVLHSLGFKTEPSKKFRDYNQWMAQNKNLLIDMLRKGLATSVTKGYVTQNLYPMLDPTSPVWSDPEYVVNSIKGFQKFLNQHAAYTTSAMTEGVPMSLNEARRRHEKIKNENLENSIKTAHTKAGVKMLAKKIELPNLPEREFRAWFVRQPRMVRDAVRMKLGEQ